MLDAGTCGEYDARCSPYAEGRRRGRGEERWLRRTLRVHVRSATGTAAVWFLVGVAAALSLTSLAIVTIPLAIVLTVVVLRKGLRDPWLCSAALIGAAVVFLFFSVRQWSVPDCSGGNSDTGSLTIHPGEESAKSRCGGLPATPVIALALLAGVLGVGGLVARSVLTRTRASG
jgi:hypothetical protein